MKGDRREDTNLTNSYLRICLHFLRESTHNKEIICIKSNFIGVTKEMGNFSLKLKKKRNCVGFCRGSSLDAFLGDELKMSNLIVSRRINFSLLDLLLADLWLCMHAAGIRKAPAGIGYKINICPSVSYFANATRHPEYLCRFRSVRAAVQKCLLLGPPVTPHPPPPALPLHAHSRSATFGWLHFSSRIRALRLIHKKKLGKWKHQGKSICGRSYPDKV